MGAEILTHSGIRYPDLRPLNKVQLSNHEKDVQQTITSLERGDGIQMVYYVVHELSVILTAI